MKSPLVEPKNVSLPHLHIKLGLMKRIMKAFYKEGECFAYSCKKPPKLSYEKLRAVIFNGPQNSTSSERCNVYKLYKN